MLVQQVVAKPTEPQHWLSHFLRRTNILLFSTTLTIHSNSDSSFTQFCLNFYFIISFLPFISLFEKQGYREGDTKKSSVFLFSLSKWPQSPVLGQAEAKSLELHPVHPRRLQKPKHWGRGHCLVPTSRAFLLRPGSGVAQLSSDLTVEVECASPQGRRLFEFVGMVIYVMFLHSNIFHNPYILYYINRYYVALWLSCLEFMCFISLD